MTITLCATKADCGIAVSDATDAARAAADIVLMTPGLSVTIDALAFEMTQLSNQLDWM